MAVVEAFEQKFREVMGPTADQSPCITKRLTACILAVAPQLNVRTAHHEDARQHVAAPPHQVAQYRSSCGSGRPL